MISIARKNLLRDKPKLLVSVGGVALSTLLILALFGIYFGIAAQARSLPLNAGAQYWVVQKGTSDLFHTVSLLPSGMEKRLRVIPGVTQASSIINHATKVEARGQKFTAAVIGYDTASGLGRPPSIYKGSATIGKHETVVDRAMAQKYGLQLGDDIRIGKISVKIVGMSLKTNSLAFQYAFISYQDAVEAFDQNNVVSYYLINISRPLSQIEDAIAKLMPTSEIKTKGAMAEGNADVITMSFKPIIALLVLIGVIVGATVIGLTIYTATVERANEYGVLKAIGVKNSQLYSIVFKQSLMCSLTGFTGGVLLFWLVQFLAFYFVPSVSFDMPTQYYWYVLALSVVMSVLAAFVPIRKINNIDPVKVFTP